MDPFLASALLMGGSMLSGAQSAGGDFKTRQHQRDLLAYANKMLGTEKIGETYRGLKDESQDFLAGMVRDFATIGAQDELSTSASLSRMGLDAGTLGIGGGIRTGASYKASSMKAQMLRDMMTSSIGIQTQKSANIAGVAGAPTQFQPDQTAELIGSGLEAYSAYANSKK